MKLIKSRINKTLSLAGYEKKFKMQPVDLCNLGLGPLEALQRANDFPFLIEIPLDRCRGLGMLAFPCSHDSRHPFIATIKAYFSSNTSSYLDSPLKRYYDLFQPKTIADYLGLCRSSVEGIFLRSPLQAIEPWGGIISPKEETRKLNVMREESEQHGTTLKQKEWSFIGPITKERGEMEFLRLTSIGSSIAKNGYIRSNEKDGDIVGKILLRENDYAVLIGAGQHRIAALAAEGYAKAPIVIRPSSVSVVNRNTVRSWPSVVNGQFSVQQALAVFDRVLDGLQPSAYNELFDN